MSGSNSNQSLNKGQETQYRVDEEKERIARHFKGTAAGYLEWDRLRREKERTSGGVKSQCEVITDEEYSDEEDWNRRRINRDPITGGYRKKANSAAVNEEDDYSIIFELPRLEKSRNTSSTKFEHEPRTGDRQAYDKERNRGRPQEYDSYDRNGPQRYRPRGRREEQRGDEPPIYYEDESPTYNRSKPRPRYVDDHSEDRRGYSQGHYQDRSRRDPGKERPKHDRDDPYHSDRERPREHHDDKIKQSSGGRVRLRPRRQSFDDEKRPSQDINFFRSQPSMASRRAPSIPHIDPPVYGSSAYPAPYPPPPQVGPQAPYRPAPYRYMVPPPQAPSFQPYAQPQGPYPAQPPPAPSIPVYSVGVHATDGARVWEVNKSDGNYHFHPFPGQAVYKS